MSERDYYDILQVRPDAESDVIQAAYRRLARKYHPDVDKSSDASERMIELNAAWEVLGDSVRRAEYDQLKGHPGARVDQRPKGDPSAHAAPTPPGAKSYDEGVPPTEPIIDDDIAHAADTPPGTMLERDDELPAPPDEVQMHTTHQPDPMDQPDAVTDGELIRQIEELFPVAWMAMLMAVCYIGMYFAVDHLPNVGTNPLPGPGWF